MGTYTYSHFQEILTIWKTQLNAELNVSEQPFPSLTHIHKSHALLQVFVEHTCVAFKTAGETASVSIMQFQKELVSQYGVTIHNLIDPCILLHISSLKAEG